MGCAWYNIWRRCVKLGLLGYSIWIAYTPFDKGVWLVHVSAYWAMWLEIHTSLRCMLIKYVTRGGGNFIWRWPIYLKFMFLVWSMYNKWNLKDFLFEYSFGEHASFFCSMKYFTKWPYLLSHIASLMDQHPGPVTRWQRYVKGPGCESDQDALSLLQLGLFRAMTLLELHGYFICSQHYQESWVLA